MGKVTFSNDFKEAYDLLIQEYGKAITAVDQEYESLIDNLASSEGDRLCGEVFPDLNIGDRVWCPYYKRMGEVFAVSPNIVTASDDYYADRCGVGQYVSDVDDISFGWNYKVRTDPSPKRGNVIEFDAVAAWYEEGTWCCSPRSNRW